MCPLDELLARAATGDVQAFAELYDRTAPDLYGLALQVVGDPDQARRATEEAYVLVWRYCARHQPSRHPAATWMLTILHGVAAGRGRPHPR